MKNEIGEEGRRQNQQHAQFFLGFTDDFTLRCYGLKNFWHSVFI